MGQPAGGPAANVSPEQRSAHERKPVCRSALSWCLASALVSGGFQDTDLGHGHEGGPEGAKTGGNCQLCSGVHRHVCGGSPSAQQTLLFVCVWGAPLPAPVSCSSEGTLRRRGFCGDQVPWPWGGLLAHGPLLWPLLCLPPLSWPFCSLRGCTLSWVAKHKTG